MNDVLYKFAKHPCMLFLWLCLAHLCEGWPRGLGTTFFYGR